MIEVSEREEYKNKENYCDYPICFTSIRHLEPIKGSTGLMQTWRMKERVSQLSIIQGFFFTHQNITSIFYYFFCF